MLQQGGIGFRQRSDGGVPRPCISRYFLNHGQYLRCGVFSLRTHYCKCVENILAMFFRSQKI